MEKNKIVSINGRGYDALTGLPVEQTSEKKAPTKKTVPAAVIHTAPQKSQTLQRRSTKKPPLSTSKNEARGPLHNVKRSMDIGRSKSITRFAPHPIVTPPAEQKKDAKDIPAMSHPSVVKAHAQILAKTNKPAASTPKTSVAIKNEAIAEALAKPTPKQKKKKTFVTRHRRFINIASVVLVVLIIGGYITYVNLPALSVNIAAAQAGIHATYPGYHPDGYSVNGPVTYSNGNVTVSFKATTGNGSYTITQTRSSWDASALQNQVNTESNGQFITTQQQGLTIYTYGNNAAWVNAGILYKIQSSGNTLLSGDQIRQIAISM